MSFVCFLLQNNWQELFSMLFYISLETIKVEHSSCNLFYEFLPLHAHFWLKLLLLCLLEFYRNLLYFRDIQVILGVGHSHVEVRRPIKRVSSLSFHQVHPSCGAQIISLGSACLHPLSHLSSSVV